MKKGKKVTSVVVALLILLTSMQLNVFASPAGELTDSVTVDGMTVNIYTDEESHVIEWYDEDTGEREWAVYNEDYSRFTVHYADGTTSEGYRDAEGNVWRDGVMTAECLSMSKTVGEVMLQEPTVSPQGYDYPPVGFNTKVYETRYAYPLSVYKAAIDFALDVVAAFCEFGIVENIVIASCRYVWNALFESGPTATAYLMGRGYANTERTKAVDILYYYRGIDSWGEYYGLLQRDVSAVYDWYG